MPANNSYTALLKIVLATITFFLAFAQSSAAQKDKYRLLVFVAEECPICQYHTLDLKEIYKEYHKENLKIELVFSNGLSNKKSISAFKYKYVLPFKMRRDHKLKRAKKYDISTTPEVVLIKNKEIIYRGKISNAFAGIGQRRRVINEFYLKDALEASLNGSLIKVSRTEPVGCLISYPKN